MKFKRYLNEYSDDVLQKAAAVSSAIENENNGWYEKIRKDCKKYLNATKNSEHLLIRWEDRATVSAYKKKVRKKRRPLDTPLVVHRYIDKIMKKKFGWRPRGSGLFCFSSSVQSSAFWVFPVGKFEFVYSNKIDDLTVHLAQAIGTGPTSMKYKFDEEKDMPVIKQSMDKALKTYKNTNFRRCLELGTDMEISIRCDHAYLIKDSLPNIHRFIYKKEEK